MRGQNQMTLKSVDTLLDVLQFATGHAAIGVPELGIVVTYESLRQQVLAMADALASAGIRLGDRAAIALPNGLLAIVSFLAATIAGAVAPLNPAYPYEEFMFLSVSRMGCAPIVVGNSQKRSSLPACVAASPRTCRKRFG